MGFNSAFKGLIMTIIRQVGHKYILNMVNDEVVPLLKQHTMKGHKVVKVQLHTFSTLINNAYEADWAPEAVSIL